MFKRIIFTSYTIGLACVALHSADAASQPNIIVFYSDDHGHADLSCQGVLDDIRTPNLDALAKEGVRMVNGYSTAPQCVPSRGGLMVGKFQSRFGLESNGMDLSGFNRELTIAERLKEIGYVTAQFGKWHLGPTQRITDHGFRHVFSQNAGRPFSANVTLSGEDRPMSNLKPQRYHIDACSAAASALIRRYHDQPFFFYIAYRAPHVPLDAPKQYLSRFPGKMPQRRRQALAMLSAVDDGVGLVTSTLEELGLKENTLVFFIGDNGAPLKIHKADIPGGGPGWDGSLNDPLNGEKGMLAEGGMHVPFVVAWPGKIPSGQVFEHPVSALDVAATAASIAGVQTAPGDLDGVDLIPYLTGRISSAPHQALMWRWVAQSAIRQGDWKLLRGGRREYLFNLATDIEEKNDLSAQHPEIADRLRARLRQWAAELDPPGLAQKPMSQTWENYFDFYLDGKPAPPLETKFRGANPSGGPVKGWIARGGKLSVNDGSLQLVSSSGGDAKSPFFVCNNLALEGPITAAITLKTEKSGNATIAWRTQGQKDFAADCRTSFAVSGSSKRDELTVTLPVAGKMIHLRIVVPAGRSQIDGLSMTDSTGMTIQLWK